MENIKNYKKGNIICTYEKPKSSFRISFILDNEDKDFINVVHYRKKSGKVEDVSYIVGTDLNTWIKWEEKLGWIKI